MKFVEIVEMVEGIESKLETLSEAKLGLLESIMIEGAGTSFDVSHHIDYLIEYVDSYSDENATVIAESVDCGEVLNIVLESARKNTSDTETFIAEAVAAVGEIDITLPADEKASVTLLSVVTNTLTEMMGEAAVESMPAEMVFDITNAAKNLDISDDAYDMDLASLVEEVSTKLEAAIKGGSIDLDSDDYEGETLSEFLNDYDDTEDLLNEMAQVNDEVLAESDNEDGIRLLTKAKEATIMLEGKYESCPKGDLKCKQSKAKKAKEYFSKHEMPGGGKGEDFAMDKLTGKLRKHVLAATKASKAANGGKALPKEYIQYVLVPGIIKRMRMKNRKMNAKSKVKKQGMR